jgi:RHS repeat-associated protein
MSLPPLLRSVVLFALFFVTSCAFGGEEGVAHQEQALTADLAPTDSVGALPGSLNVDFDGQAHYTIPIEVPPARADHVPQLAFTYSSSDAIGALGRGWSLSGLSAITRCAQSIAIDGAYRAVAYDEEDAFCLDGARLLHVGMVDGVREYRTEQESFVRAFAYEEIGVEGPSRWEVRRPDGTVALYGKGSNSQARISSEPRVASWLVSLVRDRFGNLIEVEYDHHYPTDPALDPAVTGARGLVPEVTLKRIRYGSHESVLEATAAVTFDYDLRPDVRSGHAAGLTWSQTRRLARVHTVVGDKSFRTYHLDYETTGATGASRLVSIQDCVQTTPGTAASERRDGKVCRPKTTFAWEVGDLDAENETITRHWDYEHLAESGYFGSEGGVQSWLEHTPMFTMDFDGDGADDLGYIVDGNVVVHASGESHERRIVYGNAVDFAAEARQYDVLDYNHDGRDDLGFFSLGSRRWTTDLAFELTYVIALSDGDSFSFMNTEIKKLFSWFAFAPGSQFWPIHVSEAGSSTYMSTVDLLNQNANNSFWRIADFTGDGDPDMLACEVQSRVGEHTEPSNRCIRQAEHFDWDPSGAGLGIPAHCGGELSLQGLMDGSGESPMLDVGAFCRNAHNPMLGTVVADFTGDGVADLMFLDVYSGRASQSALVPLPRSRIDEGQFHADDSDPNWKILTFDRRLGVDHRTIDTGINARYHVAPIAADLNGDGVADIVTREDDARVRDPATGGLDTLDVFREGRWARLVRHGWISTGHGFVHVNPDDLIPGASAVGDDHSNTMYLIKNCTSGYAGGCGTEAKRYAWYHQPDTCTDLDLDGRTDCVSSGVPLARALDPERGGGLARWTPEPDVFEFDTFWWRPGSDHGGRFVEASTFSESQTLRVRTLTGHYGEIERGPIARVLDANGDGVPDILSADVRNRYPSEDRFPARFKIVLNHKGEPERITEFRDGLGKRSVVSYTPMTNPDVYTSDPTCERSDPDRVRCDVDARRVVASVVTHGGELPSETRYRYWDGRTALDGRGWLGFGKVAVIDVATSRVSTYRFDRSFDAPTNAYYTARRPVHVTHLVQGRNLKHGGDSSRTVGTEILVDYDLHTHGERWSTVVAQQYVRHYEDVRYLGLDPYADEPFAGLTPVHTGTTAYTYRDDVPWSQRDLPFRTASAVDVDRDPAREYSEREYEPEPTIRPGDLSTPWIVGRVSADRSWVEGDGCESDVSVRMKYNPDHGGLETTIRQPDDLAPPRSDEDRRAEVLESYVYYDAYGNLESAVERDLDGNERTTKLHYAYPGATFPTAAENSLGHTVKAHFHPELGAPFAIIDPNGLIERTSFDGFGRVVGGSSATGDSFTVRYERRDGDPVPLRVHTSTASGSRAAQGMNAGGQVVWSEWRELRNALAVTVRALRRYDAAGRVVEESEPFFEGESATHWTRHEYDDVGTLRVAQSPAGRFTYRRTPDRRMATDALGFETTLVLDGRGNVVQGIEPAPGGTIRHAYCADGRLRRTVDPRGNTTTIEYDTLGRRRYLREPDRGEEWTDYDAFDQVVHTRDAGNRDVRLEYDRLGRLTRRTDVSGKTTWTFDAAPHGLGALASTTSPDGIATEYSYHPDGLLESEKLYADSVTLKLTYGYDAFGRPETIESPVMRTRAQYAAGMLLHVRNAATGASLWEGRTYNARGDLREERFGNGLVATREYQPGTGRLTRQLVRRSTTRLQDWTYGHDANGRVTSRRDALNSFQETYDFDPLGRLTKVISSHDPTLSLQYDVIGNLTWASDVGTLSYDGTSKPHAVRGFRGVEQQYDSVGNHLGDATRRRVEYNALDLPNNILRRADGRSIQIRYDAEGNRAATHGPDGDRYYLGPVEMRGGVFVHRVQVGGRTVAQAMRKDGTTRVDVAYVHDDHLGSTDLVTDTSGNVQARFSYDAWGARKTRTWTRAPAGPDGTPLVDHGYTGHEHDDEWGVIHMRGRAYDPAMRRMTGVDPFVVNPFGVQAFNRYSYVLNDPINHIDPSGFNAIANVNLPPPVEYQFEDDVVLGQPSKKPKGPIGAAEEPEPVPTVTTVPGPSTAPTIGAVEEPGPTSAEHPTPSRESEPDIEQLQFQSRDDVVSAGFGVLRDWTAEVNARGRIHVGGVVLPPHTAEGVAAESVETFLGNLAIIHDRDASTGDQAWAWIQIGLTVGGGLLAGVAIIQRGGGTIAKSTARALNGEFGLDLKPREWGRALEALKRFEQLPNNHHGRIMSNGDYVDEAGNVIGNLIDYL